MLWKDIPDRTCLWCADVKDTLSHWVILRCFSRCNFHKQVGARTKCLWDAFHLHPSLLQKSAKTNCLWDVSHSLQFGHSTEEQLHTKQHTVSEMRQPHEHAAAIAHPQPLRSFHSASATQGCKTLSKKTDARNIDKQQQTTLKWVCPNAATLPKMLNISMAFHGISRRSNIFCA